MAGREGMETMESDLVTFLDLDHCGAHLMRHLVRDVGPGQQLVAVVAFGLVLEPATQRSHWQTSLVVSPTLQSQGLPLTHEEIYRDVIEAAQRIIDSIQQ